jgi:hypothetical protein
LKYNHFVTEKDLIDLVAREISQGLAAREAGNEGKARVCARRAAAILVGEYLRSHGVDPGHRDAYGTLTLAASTPEVPAETREVLGHFLTRVEPGGRFPIQADLLAEARALAERLRPGNPE